MIVIVGGMYRSGSTFIFNVVKELLEKDGNVFTAYTDDFAQIASVGDQYDHILVKSHSPDSMMNILIQQSAVKCINSFRRPEDAIASWQRAFDESIHDGINLIRNWLLWYNTIKSQTFNLSYQSIDDTPLQAILDIQKYILNRIDINQATEINEKLNKSTLKVRLDALTESSQTTSGETPNGQPTFCEQSTLFHRRHISSIQSVKGIDSLSSKDISFIREQLSNFIDHEGRLNEPLTKSLEGSFPINETNNKLFELDTLVQKHDNLTTSYNLLTEEHNVLTEEHNVLTEEHNVLTEEHNVLTEEHEVLTEEHEVLTEEHEVLTEEHNVLTEEHNVLTEEHKVLTEEHKVLTEEHEVLTEEHNVLTEEHKALTIQYNECEQKFYTTINSLSWKLTSPLRQFNQIKKSFLLKKLFVTNLDELVVKLLKKLKFLFDKNQLLKAIALEFFTLLPSNIKTALINKLNKEHAMLNEELPASHDNASREVSRNNARVIEILNDLL